MSRGACAPLAVAALLLGATATAARANYVGSAEDPAGDTTGGSPARDPLGAGLAYDRRTGTLSGAIELGAEPADESDAFVSLFAGVRTPQGCNGYPAVGFATESTAFDATWLGLSSPTGASLSGEADKRGGLSTVQRFEVSDRRLGGRPADCVIATLSERGNSANVFDTVGPLKLAPQPALGLTLSRVPAVMRPDRPRTIRLTVANPGDAPTGPVRISFKRARGMRLTPASVSVKSVAPQGRRTASVRIRLTTTARSTTTLQATARAGELAVRDDDVIGLRRPAPKPPKGGGAGGSGTRTPQLCNQFQADPFGSSGGSLVLVPC